MRKVKFEEFYDLNETTNFIDGIFNSDHRFPAYSSPENYTLMVSSLEQGAIEIIEYDFYKPKVFCETNLDTIVNKMMFQGFIGNEITYIRKKAISILANKSREVDSGVKVKDEFRLSLHNSIYIKSKNVVAICGAKEIRRFIDLIKEFKGITNVFFIFPYNHYLIDSIIKNREVFYMIKVKDKFFDLLQSKEKTEGDRRREIAEKIFSNYSKLLE